MSTNSKSYSNSQGDIFDVIGESTNQSHENGYQVSYPGVLLKNRETGALTSVLNGTLHVFYREYHSIDKDLTPEQVISHLESLLTDLEKATIKESEIFINMRETARIMAENYSKSTAMFKVELHPDTIKFLATFATHYLFSLLMANDKRRQKEEKL